MRKKIVSAMLAGSLCVSIGIGAYATDYSERIAEIEAEIEALREEWRELKIASGETIVEGMELYSGEYGVLTLARIESDGIVFSLENTTDEAYSVHSDYLTVDGTQYEDEYDDEGWEFVSGGITEDIAAGGKKQFKFMIPWEEDEEVEIIELSGQFLLCEFAEGYYLDLISFSK